MLYRDYIEKMPSFQRKVIFVLPSLGFHASLGESRVEGFRVFWDLCYHRMGPFP